MNKAHLAAALSRKMGVSQKHAVDTLKVLCDLLAQGIEDGIPITLSQLGTFQSKVRPARRVRDHARQETRWIEARRVPVFKPSKALRERVKG